MEREAMQFDAVVVGGGPAGLAAACRLMQLGEAAGQPLSVCLVEKGAEIGAHILSGAIFEPRALDELFPDWQARGAPLNNPVTEDSMHYLIGERSSIRVPEPLLPKDARNEGNHAISLGNLCRWLGEQAEALGVNLFPGFAAAEVLYDGDGGDGAVAGIATGDMGRNAAGQPKDGFQPGYELRARQTIFAEGCRGHLGKQLIARFGLDRERGVQHYAIGFKELWDLAPERHRPGKVLHSMGWPLGHLPGAPTGGGFLYHLENGQASLGLILDLAYRNPHLSPFDEFQRWKRHPLIAEALQGGRRVSYGARAIVKGGLPALPRISFPGGLLAGDEAGFLNPLKIKGSHAAMKSGMLAAEAAAEQLFAADGGSREADSFAARFRSSWLHEELRRSRNAAPGLHRFGMLLGAAHALVDSWFGGLPYRLKDERPDHAGLKPASRARKIRYPKPDGVLSFDKLSSVYLSNTSHEEDQPCHLRLADADIPVLRNLPAFDEPAQRYCPAGVYEVIEQNGQPRFQINAQNCVHCKTCDIKDPAQNISWVAPEGGGGPNYPNM